MVPQANAHYYKHDSTPLPANVHFKVHYSLSTATLGDNVLGSVRPSVCASVTTLPAEPPLPV